MSRQYMALSNMQVMTQNMTYWVQKSGKCVMFSVACDVTGDIDTCNSSTLKIE